MEKSHAVEILDQIRADDLKHALGVKDRSLRLVRERDVFPASWYPVVKSLCAEGGIECRLEAFNFKSPSVCSTDAASSKEIGDTPASFKGEADTRVPTEGA